MKALSTFVLCAALSLSAYAQSSGEDEAETCLQTKIWEKYADGWSLRMLQTESLAMEEMGSYLMTFYKGNEYEILACGDTQVSDVDILLLDQNVDLIQRDSSNNREPQMALESDQTRTVYLVVRPNSLAPKSKTGAISVAVLYR